MVTGEMDIFTITVMFGTEVVDVGQCDSDRLITLIHVTIEELSGKDEVPNEDCLVWIHLPWRGERLKVNTDILQKGHLLDPMKSLKCWISRVVTKRWVRIAKLGKGIPFKKMMDGEIKFEVEAMDEIGVINLAAQSWLQEIEPKHWSRYAFDHVIRCDHVTNNMTKAFNSMLGTHRASSYLDLLEFIRRMVMRKFQERREECEQWNSVLPQRVNVKILKNSKQSTVLTIIIAGNMEYELLGPNEGYTVKLGEYSCQCGSWQVSGIPCRHAMAAISHHCGKAAVKDKMSKYVHQSLTKSAYMYTYRGMIHPIPD
ncbi:hypothetical protein EZV62_014680 [Acer yangbiense]|uniref:SWIM-type domain-containing protein n=1 Tax=Acer yangbiense TaxID=1000413 RepID=A0A5C7HSQ1_9ROSI|nr:hypothetical protein EZV62_014680 [Acer yangbiense]